MRDEPLIDRGPDGYRPGVCNIGPDEVRRRQSAALAAVGGTLLVACLLLASEVGAAGRALIFPPLWGTLVNAYQAGARFCLYFALRGVFNFGPLGSPTPVGAAADRAADRVRALRVLAGSALLAALGTAGFALAPF